MKLVTPILLALLLNSCCKFCEPVIRSVPVPYPVEVVKTVHSAASENTDNIEKVQVKLDTALDSVVALNAVIGEQETLLAELIEEGVDVDPNIASSLMLRLRAAYDQVLTKLDEAVEEARLAHERAELLEEMSRMKDIEVRDLRLRGERLELAVDTETAISDKAKRDIVDMGEEIADLEFYKKVLQWMLGIALLLSIAFLAIKYFKPFGI
tara:strand:- start:1504 stop:2133 length:630 start_codon:yes stop_codon:yes gene_type:complete